MSLRILQSGLLTTLQDLGRTGYRQVGINPTGVMDDVAARLVNYLVGNEATEGVLEFHFPIGELSLETGALIALGGADFQVTANEKPLENWRPYYLPAETRIVSRGRRKGARLYMAVRDGFAADSWMGSVSTHLKAKAGGFSGRALQKGDVLPFRNSIPPKAKTQAFTKALHPLPWKIAPGTVDTFYKQPSVQVMPGPEWEMLTPPAMELFASQSFQISSQSDRMGYRLNGPPLERLHHTELVSSAVTKGTIQLLPDGQLIVLMADHQTTGGYPRVATVTAAHLPMLAQQSAGAGMQFSLVSVKDAEDHWLEQQRLQNIIRYAAIHRIRHYFSES